MGGALSQSEASRWRLKIIRMEVSSAQKQLQHEEKGGRGGQGRGAGCLKDDSFTPSRLPAEQTEKTAITPEAL